MPTSDFCEDYMNFCDEKIDDGVIITEVNERIKIKELRDGHRFGSDAFLLSAFAKSTNGAAVELGSGSGVCSLLLADRNKASHIFAVEIEPTLAALGKENFKENGFEDKISSLNTDIRLLNKYSFDRPITTVISNPPYFKAGAGRNSPNAVRNASRREINGTIVDFCSAAARITGENGRFYCVFTAERLVDLISALRTAALEPTTLVFVQHDDKCRPSIVLVEAAKEKKAPLVISKPLVLFRDGKPTDEASKIYETCDFGGFLDE